MALNSSDVYPSIYSSIHPSVCLFFFDTLQCKLQMLRPKLLNTSVCVSLISTQYLFVTIFWRKISYKTKQSKADRIHRWLTLHPSLFTSPMLIPRLAQTLQSLGLDPSPAITAPVLEYNWTCVVKEKKLFIHLLRYNETGFQHCSRISARGSFSAGERLSPTPNTTRKSGGMVEWG